MVAGNEPRQKSSAGVVAEVIEVRYVAIIRPSAEAPGFVILVHQWEYEPTPLSLSGGARVRHNLQTALAYRLGPCHLQRNAHTEEPFLASAIRLLSLLSATATKICTTDGSMPPLGDTSTHISTPAYSALLRIYSAGEV